jgi:hypothetical protein
VRLSANVCRMALAVPKDSSNEDELMGSSNTTSTTVAGITVEAKPSTLMPVSCVADSARADDPARRIEVAITEQRKSDNCRLIDAPK